jgi:tetratricopeptide (TPR) repeat protein
MQHASLGQWQEASADCRQAIELDVMRRHSWEALGAFALHTGRIAEFEAVAKDFLGKFRNDPDAFLRMDIAVLCSLAADSKLDRQVISQLADEAHLDNPTNSFLRLGKGMAAFRCGYYEDALSLLPESGFDNPKDSLLANVFLAMARYKLGDAYTARKLLEQARQAVETQVPTPTGPPLPYQDRPLVWCMVQIALHEAEGLIERPDNEPTATNPPLEQKTEQPGG